MSAGSHSFIPSHNLTFSPSTTSWPGIESPNTESLNMEDKTMYYGQCRLWIKKKKASNKKLPSLTNYMTILKLLSFSEHLLA